MNVSIIGYSGHSYVACDIILSMGHHLFGYCEINPMDQNPYALDYLGSEKDTATLESLANTEYFIGIGHSEIRKRITDYLTSKLDKQPINAIHKQAALSGTVVLGHGIMIGPGTIVNASSQIGNGVICNSGSIIEHECSIGHFSHIAPGAVLCGNVTVGENSMIGANAVVKPGVNIGDNVVIGAGSVILKDVPSNYTVAGNPQRKL